MPRLYMLKPLRRIVLSVFSKVNPGNITIRHHYTDDPFMLHSYRHKGYWFHGKNREHDEMEMVSKLIKSGDNIVEVGAHIGYLTLYFAQLTGQEGQIIAFEPVPDSAEYLKKNTKSHSNITVERKAASDQAGTLPFYVDTLSGMTSTLVSEDNVHQANVDYAFGELQFKTIQVEVVCLDDFLNEKGFVPDFIKVDAEGAEYDIVRGLSQILAQNHPVLWLEVSRNKSELYDLLSVAGYVLIDAQGNRLMNADALPANLFCLHEHRHADLLSRITVS
ncbi:MAG: FkbM family methyltransferase [Anaerolineaceae bacterium]|nr:FkbM family methyltransferase [Anaerolineaceae bacterium]